MNKTQIFCFHRISDEVSPAYPPLPIKVFDKICSYISRKFLVIPLNEINNSFESKKQRAVITFDDAYYDFYENALSILQKYKMPATQHIITNCAETGETFWTQKLNKVIETYYFTKTKLEFPELQIDFIIKSQKETERTAIKIYLYLLNNENKESYINQLVANLNQPVVYTPMMNWEQINEVTKYNISFGSHTHTHINLKETDIKTMVFELIHSKKIIEENVKNNSCESLAFPNGQYNNAVVSEAIKCQYKYLLTTEAKYLNHELLPLVPRIELYNNKWWKNYLKLNINRFYSS